jgi:ubiquinol-cytochrome c reductase cytochrome b subunit
VLLLFHFVPDPGGAFASVRTIMRDVPFGWLVRLVHAHGANLIVIALLVHTFHTALAGAYRAPRELVWWTGCGLLLVTFLASLTGYILPWSQTSYWATTVVTASVEHVPWLGHALADFLRGGEGVNEATYRRAFAGHVGLLPLALLALGTLHVVLALREELPEGDAAGGRVLRYARAGACALLVLFALVVFAPNLFFPSAHLAPANPLDTPPDVKPEWYFLWAYQLPRMLPPRLAVALQAAAFGALLLLPLLDRSRSARPPVWLRAALILGLAAWAGLSVLGWLA